MAKATLNDNTIIKFRFTLDMYCEMTGTYKPYLRKGWHSVEYSEVKELSSKILNIPLKDIKSISI